MVVYEKRSGKVRATLLHVERETRLVVTLRSLKRAERESVARTLTGFAEALAIRFESSARRRYPV